MKHLFRQNGNQTAAIEIQFEQVNHARLSTLERGLAAEAVRGAQGGAMRRQAKSMLLRESSTMVKSVTPAFDRTRSISGWRAAWRTWYLPAKPRRSFSRKVFRVELFPPFCIAGDPVDHYAAGETAGIGSK